MNDVTIDTAIDRSDVRRWSLAAAFVVFAHVAILAAGVHWFKRHNDFVGTGSQPMMVDLESVPRNLQPPKADLAPGPEMQETPAPAPEPQQESKAEQEQIPPAPAQQNPAVVAPQEQKEAQKPDKDKEKQIQKPATSEQAAPRTTAPPKAAEAARISYMGMLAAHLQRFKQYPQAARAAGQEGVAMLSFTVNRDGTVSGGSIAKSSGSAALDNETLAMLRRAQPLPKFPAEMTQSSLSFTAPIRFSLR
ncbi:MAG: energy transducer TonB [Afipia sp.]|nr:energy transducer TonB [Afipia sp.]